MKRTDFLKVIPFLGVIPFLKGFAHSKEDGVARIDSVRKDYGPINVFKDGQQPVWKIRYEAPKAYMRKEPDGEWIQL